ncbi:FecR family protein [Azomonas agilis]|uniref:FecR family protein n=1 Tax=Azomonas agilis TaxID=116849 RepID=A0A562J0A4_9GAMM|nr:FecR domain-containing protein [Azomonas agilis]TWH76592.1 FecR family protein [Azomonas agilis]
MSINNQQQREALRMAAHWSAVLGAERVRAEDRQAWQDWCQQCPENRWAWQRLEQLQQQLQGVTGPLAYQMIQDRPNLGRRAALKALLLTGGTSALLWGVSRQLPWTHWMADQRSATGERRLLVLDDGSRLTLNTASAVDIHFDEQHRQVSLLAGEILVETAPDSMARPFWVMTRDGLVQALGTRFVVREYPEHMEVNVLEHAVNLYPHRGAEHMVRAGQSARFNTQRVLEVNGLNSTATDWLRGRLVIDNWRLEDLLAELSRYRPGYLSCDPTVADLRISGVFPLDNTDQALMAISRALPVVLVSRTHYWVRLQPPV